LALNDSERSALLPGERAPGAHWRGGLMGPRNVVKEKRHFIDPGVETKPGRQARS